MKVGIHPDHFSKHSDYSRKFKEILSLNGINYTDLHIDEPDFWQKVAKLDYFIFKFGNNHSDAQLARTILPIIETQLQIKTYPNLSTSWHYDDKIKQYYLLQNRNMPYAKCWIFWNKSNAISWLKSTEFPVVMKLSTGAGSSNVVLVNNFQQAQNFVNKAFSRGIQSLRKQKNNAEMIKKILGDILRRVHILHPVINEYWMKHKDYVLFQEFLPDNDYDTRVTTIGSRAFAFRRFNRKNDFRASGSGRISYDLKEIDLEMIKIALYISKSFNFQSMAYDFLYDKSHKPMTCEISYTYLDTAVYN
jgi:hypothetical protein